MSLDFQNLMLVAAVASGLTMGIDSLYFAKKRLLEGEIDEATGQPLEPGIVSMSRFIFPFAVALFLLFSFEFSLVLLVFIVASGVIWGLDALFFAAKRKAKFAASQDAEDKQAKSVPEPLLVEYARFLFPVVLVVFMLRGFVAEPFRIPSGSMLPTLEIGDFILVNKFAYGLRMPVFNRKLVSINNPKKGDVIVFRYPEDPSVDYIKRVVGVPGDKIGYYNKVLHINGKAVKLENDGPYIPGFPSPVRLTEEFGDVKHDILHEENARVWDKTWTVPKNSYLVFGDNRDNSKDSRYWGYVPDANLVGKATLVWMNWDFGHWPKLGRVGTMIK